MTVSATPSTWTWVGTTTAWANASNWTLTSGSGNSNHYPGAGDTALLDTVTTSPPVITGSILSSNTIDISTGTTLDFANGSTLDAGSVVNDTSNAATVNLTGATFFDYGDIEVVQPGAVLTINLNGGTLVSNGLSGDIGLNAGAQGVANSGTMFVIGGTLADQEVHVNDGTAEITSAMMNNDLLSVDNGLLEFAQPTTVSPGGISFVSGGTSTVKFDNPGSFNADGGGQISGFAANDTIDIGTQLIGSIVYSGDLGGYAELNVENSSGSTIFSAVLSGGDEATLPAASGTVSASGGTVGGFRVSQGGGQDTLITESGSLTAGPIVRAGSNVSYTAGGSPATLDSGLTVTDSESANLTGASVAITAGFLAGDILNVGSPQSGIISNYNTATGTLTLSGTAAVGTYQTELDSITYSSSVSDPTSGGTDDGRTIGWIANDGTTTGNANSSVMVIGPTPPGPVVTAGASVGYTAGGSPTTLDSGLTVTDSESSNLTGATIAITSGFLAGDTLTVGSAQSGIISNYNTATGTLTLTGSASVGTYQTELDSIAYSSSANNPTSGGTDDSRTIGWIVNDGTTTGNANSSVTVSGSISTGTTTDILFRDSATGDAGYDAVPSGNGQGTWIDFGDSSTAYSIVGVGNFTGGGTAEILFRDSTTGDTGVYTPPTAPGGTGTWADIGDPSTAYTVAGDGNFTGNGQDDILFRNLSTGDMGYFALNSSGPNTWQGLGSPSLLYSVVGIGDFNGNGTSDILMQNTSTGQMGYISMPSGGGGQGTWIGLGSPSTAYSVVGIGNFTGGTEADILFRDNANGDTGYYAPGAGGGPGTWTDLGISSTAYTVVGVADFTGSGISDILYRNTSTGDLGYSVPAGSGQGTWHDLGDPSTAYAVVSSPTFG